MTTTHTATDAAHLTKCLNCRLAWDDERIAHHQAAGADRDAAITLTSIEWAEFSGEEID